MDYKNMNVTIDVTSKCNLRCKHCRVNEIEQDMSLNDIKMVFSKLKPFNPRGVFISGGEPLTRNDIVDIVYEAKKLAPITILNTNSLLLTDELLEKLANSGLNYIQVSLDGIEPLHDFIRGEGTYRKTIEKMRMINKYSDVIKLQINSVVCMDNLQYMEDLAYQILEVENIDVEMLGYKRFVPSNVLKDTAALGKDGLKQMYENVKKIEKKYGYKTKIRTEIPMKNTFDPENTKRIVDKYNLGCAGCSAGVDGISIRNDGTVTPCTLLYIKCGNILTDSLEDIENNIDMKNIRERKLQGKCGECKFKDICGGCRAVAYQLSGNFLGEDEECFI